MAIYPFSIPFTRGDKKSIEKDSASKQQIMQSWVPCCASSQENFLNPETDQCTLPTSLPCSLPPLHTLRYIFFWANFEFKCNTSFKYYIYCKLLFIPGILPLCWVPVSVNFSCLISVVAFTLCDVVLASCPCPPLPIPLLLWRSL